VTADLTGLSRYWELSLFQGQSDICRLKNFSLLFAQDKGHIKRIRNFSEDIIESSWLKELKYMISGL